MPAKFTGGTERRFARLDQHGRRCIGQNSHCVNAAIDEWDVIPVLHGLPNFSAPVTTLKTCGRHRIVVFADKKLHVVEHRPGVLKESNVA